MRIRLHKILIGAMIASSVAIAGPEDCVRSMTPKRNLVYLHGIDSAAPSKQELFQSQTFKNPH